MVALSAPAQRDGNVERMAEMVHDPLPRNASAVSARRAISAVFDWVTSGVGSERARPFRHQLLWV
jgi:hypothetical protein